MPLRLLFAIWCGFCAIEHRTSETLGQEPLSTQPSVGESMPAPAPVQNVNPVPSDAGAVVLEGSQSAEPMVEPLAEPVVELPPPPVVATENTLIDLGDKLDSVRFTFREAPWPDVLEAFANWAGLTLDLTDTPPGYFNYFDEKSHTPTEAIDILNGYLLPRGYVLLRRDQFLVAIKTDNPVLGNLVPTVDSESLPSRGTHELVRIVVTVPEISPVVAAEEIRGLLGPLGSATPLDSSQSLVIQGFGGTLRQALDLIQKSKPPITDDKLDFRAFALKHLPAAEAETQIRTLFGITSSRAAVNVSSAREDIDRSAMMRSRDRNGREGDQRQPQVVSPTPLLKRVAMNMQVSSLERTNSLLVTATPEGLLLVEGVLKAIDVEQTDAPENWNQDTEPFLRVYTMSSADEGEVAKTLDVLMPGIVVNEDRRQDTIHIFATAAEHAEAARLLQTLDQTERSERLVEVIPLRSMHPTQAAMTLQKLFENDDRQTRPMIQAELPTRSLVIRGSAAQIEQVKGALAGLGESVSAGPAASPTAKVKRIAVGNRNAEVIAKATEKILSSDHHFQNSIRVVVPSERSRKQTSTANPVMNREASSKVGADAYHAISKVSAVGTLVTASETKPDKKLEPTATPARESVHIEVEGDELLLYSGDAEALADVEGVIRELMRQMPDRTKWTVFYLKVAEAESAAAKLNELTTISSSDPLPVIDELPLRIVPDKRTNAIFVSGSDAKIEEVEQFLEYIDAHDVPGSFMRREPHAILVQYADVNEIAELLRNLYKDYLTDPVVERLRLERSSRSGDRDSSSGNGGRPSGSGASGGSSSSASSKEASPGIRLTLAVDNRTGELLVACNDQLFQEIQAVVRQRDEAVRDSQPTVHVVPVSGNVPENMMQMLQGLSPRIQTETIIPIPSPSTNNNSNQTGRQDRRYSGVGQRGR